MTMIINPFLMGLRPPSTAYPIIKDTDAFGAPNLRIYKDLIAAIRSNDPAKIKKAFG